MFFHSIRLTRMDDEFGSNGKSSVAAICEISQACRLTMKARISVPGSGAGGKRWHPKQARFCPEETHVQTGQICRTKHDGFHILHLRIIIPQTTFLRQAMKTVAYLRVSTARQDAGSQRLAILEHARGEGLPIDDFVEATASSRTNAKRRRLEQLMAVLEPGDRIVVSELSRLGRSLGEVVAMLDAIAKAGVTFVAIKENIRFKGQRDIQTKVMTTMFALFAEVERDLISERTREGLAKARASGKKLGRPKGSLGISRLDGKEHEVRQFLELGVSKTAIAKITGVSRSTLYNFIATRGLKFKR